MQKGRLVALKARTKSVRFRLDPADSRRLAELCGRLDEHLHVIESGLDVSIASRGNVFSVTGAPGAPERAQAVVEALYRATAGGAAVGMETVRKLLGAGALAPAAGPGGTALRIPKTEVCGRTSTQQRYIRDILANDITFGIGPAGTGKTYLAVACAVDALERDRVERIMLVRPAVEAGERLGFLPGDLGQKVDPYLRPLYDALNDMLGPDRVARLVEKNLIELAPLAYMRGRTLNNSFIILDEAQNTTVEQMKMFLTRLGFSARIVVTGDVTQTDLPKGQMSGLRHAIDVLQGIESICFVHFGPEDIVRHPLVQKIVDAYERVPRS